MKKKFSMEQNKFNAFIATTIAIVLTVAVVWTGVSHYNKFIKDEAPATAAVAVIEAEV